MQAEIDRLREAIREFGAPSDVEPRAGWQDVAVWYGTLLLLGPRATRGVGAFASVALISRTWSRRQFRVEDRMRHVLRGTLDLLAEDLEDRAALEEAVDGVERQLTTFSDRAGQRIATLERWVGIDFDDGTRDLSGPTLMARVVDFAERQTRILEIVGELQGTSANMVTALRDTGLVEGVPVNVGELVVTKDDVREYLDGCIGVWRDHVRQAELNDDGERRTMAVHYVDAFQSARVSLLGEPLPLDAEVPRGLLAMNRAYPYEDGDTLVIGPEAFVAMPGKAVISWRGENYYASPFDAGSVILADDEADALRASVMGDHFDNAVMERALAKVQPAHERLLERDALRDEAQALGADPDDRAEAARVRADLAPAGEPGGLCKSCSEEWAIVDSVTSAEETVLPWHGPVEVVAVHASTPSRIADTIEALHEAVTAAIDESGNGTAALRVYVPGQPLLRSPQSEEEGRPA